MLKRKASRDQQIAQLSDRSALLYLLSIPHLDVEGRMVGLPASVRGLVVPEFARLRPSDWTDQHVASYIFEWTSTVNLDGAIDPLVLWYAAAGENVLQFTGFAKNQTLRRDREAPSRLPAPPPGVLEDPASASASVAFIPNSGSEAEVQPEDSTTGLYVARAREAAQLEGLQIAQELERSLASSAPRGFGASTAGDLMTPSDDELVRICADLRGADDGTMHQLKVWRRRGCGEREFAIAWESLVGRRKKSPALVSEARYLCSELSRLLQERAAA